MRKQISKDVEKYLNQINIEKMKTTKQQNKQYINQIKKKQ